MSTSIKNKLLSDKTLLFIILIAAAILRFWNFHEMPFMHDELSAIERAKYTTLNDEIIYGVALNDTHPAGVQLFIYYWIKIFGMSEMSVKLPFILLGLLSIIVAYKISKNWFNSSVGLTVAAFMAVLQYMVMYSQIARPYIPGMFFSLLMVWCWSNYLFDQTNKGKNKWLIGYILSSALCAYTHHFALLFAVIVGITGLFFLSKESWKKYILAGISIFILYIPHLNIFFFQLNKGGLGGPDGWLGKPDSSWFFQYLKYLFHYSYCMYILVFLLIALSIFFYSNEIKTKQKFRVIAVVWFLSIFFIEYYYSILVNPIIQFSTLIFVFPFLLIFLFSLFGELSQTIKMAVVSAILITGIITLVVTRKHFDIFYRQPYQEQVKNTYKSLDIIKNEKDATIELMIPPYYRDYYFKKYNRRFESVFYNSFDTKPDTKAFREFVQKQTTTYFITGNLPLEYLQIIKEKYPYIMSKEEGFTYSTYCFTKDKKQSRLYEHTLFNQKFDLSNGKNRADSTTEYFQAHSFKLYEIVNNRHSVINLSMQVSSSDITANPVLVMDIQDNNKSIDWRGSEYFNFNNEPKGINTVFLSADLTSFDLKKYPYAEAKIFIWNRNKKEFLIDDFKINVTDGNHLMYSLYEPID